MKKTLVCTALGVVALLAASPASASAPEPHVGNPEASCTGLALSEHAVNDGAGTIAALVVEAKQLAEAFGFDNLGEVVSRWSQVHAGTHVPGCEDAFVQILLEGP
jgi:hypothetical protein